MLISGKRMYAQADRMAVEAENMTDKLSKAAEKVSQEAIALPNQTQEETNPISNLVPTCNRKASHVGDIYKIKDILSDKEVEILKSAVEPLLEEYDTKEKIFEAQKGKDRKISELFGHFLEENLRNTDYQKVAIALYMDGIVKFLDMRSNQFEKGMDKYFLVLILLDKN